MKQIVVIIVIIGLLFVSLRAMAQSTNAVEDAAHQELRAVRDGLIGAMNSGDVEKSLPFLHTNCVITWHNAEVSRGHAGVRDYHNRVMTGPTKLVDSFSCEIKVDELTILYGGDTGICFGSSKEHFKLTNGKTLDVAGRWSAVLVKENGRWWVANLHASTNLFDNVILRLAKNAAWWAGMVSLLLGAVTGFLIGRKFARVK